MKLWTKVRKYGRRKGLSPEDAEDFASHVIERKLRNPSITLILKFCLIDYRRSTMGSTRQDNFDVVNAMRTAYSFDEDHFVVYDKPNFIDTLFAELNENDCRLLMLRYYEGLDNSEIGIIYGVTPVTVSHRVNRILRMLRKDLKENK